MGREFVECLTTCNNTITRISANFRNMEKPIKIIGWMNSVHVWDDQNDIKMLTCSTFFLSTNRHATVCVITTYGDRPKIEMCTLTSGWRALKLHQHVCIHFVFPWGDTFTHKHAYLVSTCFNYDWWLVLLKPQWNNLKQFLRVGAGERCVFRYLLLARSFCKKTIIAVFLTTNPVQEPPLNSSQILQHQEFSSPKAPGLQFFVIIV